MKKLLLLGVWDTTPADSWQWMAIEMVRYFKKLTGFRLGYLAIRENNLNKECLFRAEVNKLYKYFNECSIKKKQHFVRAILSDYFRQARVMARFLSRIRKVNFHQKSKAEIVVILEDWCQILPLTTMQIWFAVLIDIWYPEPNYLLTIKKELGRARDKSGKLQGEAYKIAWRIYKVAAERLTF